MLIANKVFAGTVLLTLLGAVWVATLPGAPTPEGLRGGLDSLRNEDIPAAERMPWHPKELVAVLGEEAGRHWSYVQCAAFSPGGDLVATGAGYYVYLWEYPSLRLRHLLPAPGWAHQVAFASDGVLVVNDAKVRIWDLAGKGEPRLRAAITTIAPVMGFALSPDGRWLAVGRDERLELWDLKLPKPKVGPTVSVPQGREVMAAAFSHDSGTLAVVTGEAKSVYIGGRYQTVTFHSKRRLSVWDLAGPRLNRRFEHEDDGLTGLLAFLPGRDRLLCGSILDVATSPPKVVGTIEPAAKGNVDKIHQSGNGTQAVLETRADQGKAVQVWELGSKAKALRSVQFPTYLGDRPVLAVRGDQWAVAHGCLLRAGGLEGGSFRTAAPRGHRDAVAALAIDRSSRVVASAAKDGTIRRWRAPGFVSERSAVIKGEADRLALSPDGSVLAGTDSRRLRVWDVRAEEPKAVFERGGLEGLSPAALAFAPNGKALALTGLAPEDPGSSLTGVAIFDPLNFRKAPTRFDVRTGDALAMALCDNGRAVVCGKAGLEAWPRATRERHEEHVIGNSAVEVAAVSSDSNRTAVGGRNLKQQGRVALYDTSKKLPKMVVEYGKHRAPVIAVALTPDGKKLASSDDSGTVYVLDPDRPEPVHEWEFPGPVRSLAFSHDGRHLLTGNENGTIYVLRLGERRAGQ